MNYLTSLKLKTATEKDVALVMNEKKMDPTPFQLRAVECPPEEELDEELLDPKLPELPDPKDLPKPKVKKRKKKKKPTGPQVLVDVMEREACENLYNRLPDITPPDTKDGTFFRREKSMNKPPPNQNFVEISFPPKDQMKKSMTQKQDDKRYKPTVELMVRSTQPTGNIYHLNQKIRINFSHTMYQEDVSITPKRDDIERLQKKVQRMVKVTPPLPMKGLWKWDTTTMLTFTPDEKDELAGKYVPSTTYNVEIPAGTKSKRGHILKNNVNFSFTTPVLHVKNFVPATTYPHLLTKDPILGVEFSQQVILKKLLKRIYIARSGSSDEYLKLELLKTDDVIKRINDEAFFTMQFHSNVHPGHIFANSAEIYHIEVETDEIDPEDPEKKRLLMKKIPKVRSFNNNIVFFRPIKRLIGNTNYECFIRKGVKPVRGNLPMANDSKFQFRTMANLAVSSCNIPGSIYENDKVKWYIVFNNFLNHELWKKNVSKWLKWKNIKDVKYSYDPEKKRIEFEGQVLRRKKKCSVTLSKKIEDIYANTFGEDDKIYNMTIYDRGFRVSNSPHGSTQRAFDDVSWTISFNWGVSMRQIEEYEQKRKLHELIRVEPPLKKQRLEVLGNRVVVHGNPIGEKEFKIYISKKLLSVYETENISEEEIRIFVGMEPPLLEAQHRNYMYIFDPTNPTTPTGYTFTTRNYDKVRIMIWQVNPKTDFHTCHPMGFWSIQMRNWTKFNQLYDIHKLVGLPKKKIVFNELVSTEGVFNEKKIVTFEMSKYLQHPASKLGQVYVVVGPPDMKDLSKCQYCWMQFTRSSFEAQFTNDRNLTLIANSLMDGKYIANPTYTLCSWPDYTYYKSSETTEKKRVVEVYKYYEGFRGYSTKVKGSETGLTFYNLDSEKRNFFVNSRNLICMENGEDVCFIVGAHDPTYHNNQKPKILSFVFDDKKMFKPKENVHVKGILRFLDFTDKQRKLGLVKEGLTIKYAVHDSRDVKYISKEVEVDDCSSIYFQIPLPDKVNLGEHKIKFEVVDWKEHFPNDLEGYEFEHAFKVEEFEPPEFVTACNSQEKSYYFDQKAIVTAKATYYSGSGLYDCKVNWNVTQALDNSYNPAVQGALSGQYKFKLEPRFHGYRINPGYSNYNMQPKSTYNLSDGSCKTNPSGEHKMLVELNNPQKFMNMNNYQVIQKRSYLTEEGKLRTSKITIWPQKDNSVGKNIILPLLNDKVNDVFSTIKLTCKANITDISQNVLTCQTNFQIHPCRYYVGIRNTLNSIQLGNNIKIDIVVVKSAGTGAPVAGIPVCVELFHNTVKMSEFFLKSQAKPYELSVPLYEEWGTGNYTFAATVFDEKGYQHVSTSTFYTSLARPIGSAVSVADIDNKLKSFRFDDPINYPEEKLRQDHLQIILNKNEYFVGETAQIIVKSTIHGEGYFNIYSHSVIYRQQFSMEKGKPKETTIEVKIGEEFVPNCKISCIITGTRPRVDVNSFEISGAAVRDMPAYAKGEATFRASPKSFKIDVTVKPNEEIYSPGEEGFCTVQASKPGSSIVTLLIVDASVLALTGYHLTFPVDHFYPQNLIQTFEYFLRKDVFVRKWKASMEKVEAEKTRLEKQREERMEKSKMDDEQRKEELKIRAEEKKKLTELEAKKRRLYELKKQMLLPKKPQLSDLQSILGGFSLERTKGRGKRRPQKKLFSRSKKKKSKSSFSPQILRKSAAPPPMPSFAMPAMAMRMESAAPMMDDCLSLDLEEEEDCGDEMMMKMEMEEEKCMDEDDDDESEDDEEDEGEGGFDMGEIMEDDGTETAPIAMRKLFESTVVFANCVRTDEQGKAIVPFTLPDNLTEYKIWTLVEQDAKFYGFGESSLIAKLPFSIRPVMPTFLNFGDRIEMGFILGNTSENALRLRCALRASEGLLNYGNDGYIVTIPKGLRGEVKFKLMASGVGESRLQVAASAGKFNDAVEKPVAVYSPSLVSNFVQYGELDADACHIQQVIPPEESEVYRGFGGLEVQASSTIFQQLTDAFLYVYGYQFDCVEQACSRIMSIYTMVDIVEAFQLKDVDKKDKILKVMETSMIKLNEAQKENGGYGFWTRGSAMNIYLSIHAAHASIRVRQKYPHLFADTSPQTKKFKAMMERSKKFVYSLTSYIPTGYRREANVSVRAFSLYVLALFHEEKLLTEREAQKCLKRVNQLYADFGNLDTQTNESKAWLAYALSILGDEKSKRKEKIDALLNSLYQCLHEEKEVAYFSSKVTYEERFAKLEMLGSFLRENGIILEVLCKLNPTDAVVPKLAKHLMKLKKYGKWGNTNENQAVLLGLTTYFNIFEKDTPDFTCNIWVQEEYMGEIGFKGRETDIKHFEIPMDKLAITEEEKKLISEKRKVLEKKADEARELTKKQIDEMNMSYEKKFGELFNFIKKKYEMDLNNIQESHAGEMKDIEAVLLGGDDGKQKQEEEESKKKKKKKSFKLFDFGSKANPTGSGGKKKKPEEEEEEVGDDDIDFFSAQIEKKKKSLLVDPKIKFDRTPVPEDLDFFAKKIMKNRRLTEFDETHEDEEEKILNQIKNKRVFIMKKGKGRLYYRLKFRYAPKDLKIYAFDFGFNVVRSYHHVEKQEEVIKDIKTNTYDVKYGSLVRVRVQFTTKARRFHVALCDNVPAGLEVLNPNLKTTIAIPKDPDYNYNKIWYDHVNYRLDRVEAFKGELGPGTYHFSYVCRAKYVGQFVCLPAKCEEMYNEEINGQSDTDFMGIKVIEEDEESEYETESSEEENEGEDSD